MKKGLIRSTFMLALAAGTLLILPSQAEAQTLLSKTYCIGDVAYRDTYTQRHFLFWTWTGTKTEELGACSDYFF